MSVRRPAEVLQVVMVVMLLVVGPEAAAQPDPAQPGVCYATLGNNAAVPGALVTLNVTTGQGTLVGPTGIAGEFGDDGVPALAIKSTGEIYAADIGPTSSLYRVDATTGAATVVAATALSSPPAIAFDGADILWAVDNVGNLHIVDDATGASTLVGATGAFIKGLAFDPGDGILWGIDAGGGVYNIDLHSATATLIGSTGLPASADIHFDGAGTLYASSGGGFAVNNLISIDKATGEGTVIGSTGFVSVAGMAMMLDRIVPVALQAYESRWTGNSVEVTWQLIDVAGDVTFGVRRARNDEQFVSIVDPDIGEQRSGTFVLIDDTVEHGATYQYQVSVFADGREVASFRTTVAIPALTLTLTLGQNVPNPFNPTTRIGFTVPTPGHVSLEVYDVAGRLVRTLVDTSTPAGSFATSWNGLNDAHAPMPGGVYFYRIRAGKHTVTRKMVLLK